MRNGSAKLIPRCECWSRAHFRLCRIKYVLFGFRGKNRPFRRRRAKSSWPTSVELHKASRQAKPLSVTVVRLSYSTFSATGPSPSTMPTILSGLANCLPNCVPRWFPVCTLGRSLKSVRFYSGKVAHARCRIPRMISDLSGRSSPRLDQEASSPRRVPGFTSGSLEVQESFARANAHLHRGSPTALRSEADYFWRAR